jgi:pimeloyl-ACP methyl ester carboxylesterase
MRVVLLPGMDGTGELFRWFIEKLPTSLAAQVVSYPPDLPLSYDQLANRVLSELPPERPYIIVAESYSGPVAVLLAGRAGPNLQAIVLVATFVRPSWRRGARALARSLPPSFFRLRPPRWMLRAFMLNFTPCPDVLPCLERAIASISPEVLSRRFQDALDVDVSEMLARCPVRTAYLQAEQDRLLGRRGLQSVLAARPSTEVLRIPGPHLLLQCNPEGAARALDQAGLLSTL